MPIKKIYQSDWLGSSPIFYNEVTGKVSDNVNDVIDFDNIKFHPEGLNNYLHFGYSVFEQTPIKNIKFLRHSSKLILFEDAKIKIEYLDDQIDKLIDSESSEKTVLELLKNSIQSWEAKSKGPIIIPTSGGFDSRLLNLLIKDKSRIQSFTFGTSDKQSSSFEVVNAKAIAKRLNTNWKQIEIKNQENYIDDWFDIYGTSTHAHGMYQMEFYDKISKIIGNGYPLLSGIIGDAWAGSVNIDNIDDYTAVDLLGYSHGLHADSSQSKLKSNDELKKKYFEDKKILLKKEKYRVIESMRFKMTLLSYLIKIPAHYKFRAWSPFLDMNIALSMLNLPSDRKNNRQWQRDLFKKNNLDLEKDLPFKNRKNTLDLKLLIDEKLDLLDKEKLSEIINPDYIDWINNTISSSKKTLLRKKILGLPFSISSYLPKINNIAKEIGLDNYQIDGPEGKALAAYLTLKPLELIILKRDKLSKYGK